MKAFAIAVAVVVGVSVAAGAQMTPGVPPLVQQQFDNLADGTDVNFTAGTWQIGSTAVTATAAELNLNDNSAQAMAPGTGADGMDAYGGGAVLNGTVYVTRMVVDFDGLNSSAAADIIGEDGVANAHIGQITAALNGTLVAGRITCLQAPTGGEPDIDLYSATEATGTEDAAISGLVETALLENTEDWTVGMSKAITTMPAADQYLYLVGSGGGTDATYTAGVFLIEFYGT